MTPTELSRRCGDAQELREAIDNLVDAVGRHALLDTLPNHAEVRRWEVDLNLAAELAWAIEDALQEEFEGIEETPA